MAWDDKNYFWTCKECRHWHNEGTDDAVCEAHNMLFYKGTPFCQYFETKDGKRPRFCRLAGSVDEMARNMVYCNDYNYGRWVLKIGRKEELFLEMEDAIAAAKAWLMEVEA